MASFLNPRANLFNEFVMSKASLEDIDVLAILEESNYPSDEAATLETMTMRLEVAGDFFLTLRLNDSIIGFINGTRSNSPLIEHASMTSHDSIGSSLVIHSVVIDTPYRRNGYATRFLTNYITQISSSFSDIKRILLLSKAALLPLYMKADFGVVGVSSVIHGKDIWYEMKYDLTERRQPTQYQVDAFTSKPFGGNPAAVLLLLNQSKSDSWMLSLAEENNLSETAFIEPLPQQPSGDSTGDSKASTSAISSFNLRWFTPTNEVELCGHATLASAHTLYEQNIVPTHHTIHFHTKYAGTLTAEFDSSNGYVKLNFPQSTPKDLEAPLTDEQYAALESGLVLRKQDILFIGNTVYDLFLEVRRDAFQSLRPKNFDAIASLGGRGVIVTCLGGNRAREQSVEALPEGDEAQRTGGYSLREVMLDRRFDFLSRCFFPRYGINEDPVTGSAHCGLAPYWATRIGEKSLTGYQASRRGGIVGVSLADGDRVVLSGPSVTTISSKVVV